MIPYNEALQLWGLSKVQAANPTVKFVRESVTVEMDFNEGYACCGGSDPDCYCSFAESPRSDVKVTAQAEGPYPRDRWTPAGGVYTWTEAAEDFEFAEMVRELFDIAVAAENT